VPRDEARTNDDGQEFCDDCYGELYCSCEECGSEVAVDDLHCHNDTCYCESCFDQQFTSCDSCCETAVRDQCVCYGRDQTICQSCYQENYFACERCEEVCHFDDYGEDGCCCECSEANREDIRALPFRSRDNSCHRTGSQRSFGIELETSSCDGYLELDGEVSFSSKDDGSIAAKEFVSEVLCGDDGLAAVENFCHRAAELGFEVDSTCGYHLHVDVSDLNQTQLASVATAYGLTYKLWTSFVSDSRRRNNYCARHSWNINAHREYERFADFARAQDRYQWFNVRAYCTHSTFEIRLHSGTLNAVKICNWIIAQLRFVEAVAHLPSEEVFRLFANESLSSQFLNCCEFWPEDVAEYLRERAAKFGTTLPTLAPMTA
jgi:hypothetical protein